MKKLILFFLVAFNNFIYASFPVYDSIEIINTDPTTDSWIPIIILFWLLVLSIPFLVVRFIKKNVNRDKRK